MPERVKLSGGTYFGYDTIISDFVELQGKDLAGNKLSLTLGLQVVLRGDSVTGYVPGGFSDGTKGRIVGFRDGGGDASDNIVQVESGGRKGWVKPSNIR